MVQLEDFQPYKQFSIFYRSPINPSASWQHFDVPLEPGPGWERIDGQAATAADFDRVMSNLSLEIESDYSRASGNTVGLDNVVFEGATIAPAQTTDLRTAINVATQTATEGFAVVAIHNDGPAPATDVVVSVHLPSGAREIKYDRDYGCVAGSDTSYECTISDFPTSSYEQITFNWTPSGGGTQTIQATTRHGGSDPNSSNNTASHTFGSAPPPVIGKAVNVAAVSGIVRVREPGAGSFARLRMTTQIPVGSEVDASRGRVRLTSAVDRRGRTQAADFFDGRFVVTQSRRGNGLTQLRLSGPKPACGASARASAKQAPRLWGDGKGHFRTRGSGGTATVRGTRWLTEDRCAGTYVRVARGQVDVRDFRRGKTVKVTVGKSYLAGTRR